MYTTNIIPVEQRIKEYKTEALNNKILKESKSNRKFTNIFSKLLG
ncbi:hypothetical protein [Nosocomiicoccus ampullae]|uniref:Uncharacterized protein n=1 Tax=Nosocomiicoccus ampullae TaxID=489910 RepID=A0A9Q2D141_9STAP|nr:hypothetical protein [Nosocomiicoccus ampullae]MBB5176520.1 hypothetical protein [Nosocomiicoccus ampullae]